MRHYFMFDNTDSRTFGVYISGGGTYSSPSRAYELISIAGRNGDLSGFEKRLENTIVTYPAFIFDSFNSNLRNLRSFLLSKRGYFRLEDTYHTDEYRMALYRGGLEPEVVENKAGSFEIVFECMPQRFLTSGETTITLTTDDTVSNPTYFPAKPLLRVYGTGTLGINSDNIIISAVDTYVDIDCDIMEAYKGSVNCNANISVSGTSFPVLESGANSIALGTGITKVEITPRWYQV